MKTFEISDLKELKFEEARETNGGCDAQSGTCIMGFIAAVGSGLEAGFNAAYSSWNKFLSANT